MPKTTAKTPAKKTAAPKTAIKPLTPALSTAGVPPTTPVGGAALMPQKISTPEELFVSDLRDLYWSELHLVKALPKMADSAGTVELKSAFEEHLEVTRGHVTRLEQVFDLLGSPNLAKKCDALEGLVVSGEQIIETTLAGTPVRETGLIASGIKVENFEITCYTSLIQLAGTLGLTEAADILTLNLEEEQEASALLMSLAAEQGK